jgi:hypothetical protein
MRHTPGSRRLHHLTLLAATLTACGSDPDKADDPTTTARRTPIRAVTRTGAARIVDHYEEIHAKGEPKGLGIEYRMVDSR